jgi:hypothetical protein
MVLAECDRGKVTPRQVTIVTCFTEGANLAGKILRRQLVGTLQKYSVAKGLFIQMTWFPLFGHLRVFIPWNELHNAILVSGLGYWAHYVFAEVRNPSITMWIHCAIFEETEGHGLVITTGNCF